MAQTIKELLIARASPWNHVPSKIINAIIEGISDKGLLEAFVMRSMETNLVSRYEKLDEADSSEVIRAQISQILCEAGSCAVPSLVQALEKNQRDFAIKALTVAGDTFEAAIALAKNQIAAYAGLATVYAIVGKKTESQKYAAQGLSELEKMRGDDSAKALTQSAIFPADFFDQAEQQLRNFLKP